MMRMLTVALVAALVLTGASLDTRAQSDAPPIKIGYAISRTGPFAPGAQATQEPSYILGAEQVSAAGGISVRGQKRKVELISYDDRSEVETIVRTFEKLMVTDKVDLILPPWGSTANFAVAPLANRHGYPVLAPTALSMKLVDMKLPYFFSMLPQPYVLMAAAADMLAANGIKTVAGIGSWSVKTSPAAKAFFDAHVARFQKEPDRWASAHCWAGLQILQAAIEKVGVDRKAIRDFIATGEHATIIGPVRFKGSEIQFPGTVSQWVGGDFDVVWPADRATAKLVVPKPAWK